MTVKRLFAPFSIVLFAMRRSFILGCGVFLLIALPFLSSRAFADFRVCNATQRKVGVAIGYRAQAGWMSEGWWQIEPTNCKTLIEGDLSSRFYYLYAEDADGVERWNGSVNMCVSENEFKIEGVKNCFPRGFQKFGFREIDTKKQTSWMVQLTDTPVAMGKPAKTGDNPVKTTGQSGLTSANK